MHLQAQGNNEKCCQTSACRKLIPEHCVEGNEEIGIVGEKGKTWRSCDWFGQSEPSHIYTYIYIYECEKKVGNVNYICLKNQMYVLCSYNGIN